MRFTYSGSPDNIGRLLDPEYELTGFLSDLQEVMSCLGSEMWMELSGRIPAFKVVDDISVDFQDARGGDELDVRIQGRHAPEYLDMIVSGAAFSLDTSDRSSRNETKSVDVRLPMELLGAYALPRLSVERFALFDRNARFRAPVVTATFPPPEKNKSSMRPRMVIDGAHLNLNFNAFENWWRNRLSSDGFVLMTSSVDYTRDLGLSDVERTEDWYVTDGTLFPLHVSFDEEGRHAKGLEAGLMRNMPLVWEYFARTQFQRYALAASFHGSFADDASEQFPAFYNHLRHPSLERPDLVLALSASIIETISTAWRVLDERGREQLDDVGEDDYESHLLTGQLTEPERTLADEENLYNWLDMEMSDSIVDFMYDAVRERHPSHLQVERGDYLYMAEDIMLRRRVFTPN